MEVKNEHARDDDNDSSITVQAYALSTWTSKLLQERFHIQDTKWGDNRIRFLYWNDHTDTKQHLSNDYHDNTNKKLRLRKGELRWN